MVNEVIIHLVRSMGFCCIYSFIRAVRGRSHIRVALRIGVSEIVIYRWRRKVKEGKCTCAGGDARLCANAKYKTKIPRVELSSLGKYPADPFVD